MILIMTSKETDILCTLDQIGKVNEGYQKVKLTVGHVTVLDTVSLFSPAPTSNKFALL